MSDLKFERKKLTNPLPPSVEAKWSQKVLDERFVPLPKRLLRCLPTVFKGEHAMEDLAVVLAIVDYLRPGLSRGPSIDFLAFTAGLARDVFVERARSLEERGLIRRNGSDDAVEFSVKGLEEEIVRQTD
jgi:hypothetical protein